MDIQKLIQDEAERSAKGYYGVTTLEYDHLVNETTYGKGYMTGASFALSLDRWVKWEIEKPVKSDWILAMIYGSNMPVVLWFNKGMGNCLDEHSLLADVEYWQPITPPSQ